MVWYPAELTALISLREGKTMRMYLLLAALVLAAVWVTGCVVIN